MKIIIISDFHIEVKNTFVNDICNLSSLIKNLPGKKKQKKQCIYHFKKFISQFPKFSCSRVKSVLYSQDDCKSNENKISKIDKVITVNFESL